MDTIRTIDEFTTDFSRDYRIEVGFDAEEGEPILGFPSTKHIRLIEKDLVFGADSFYITFDQLVDIVDSGKGKLIEITPLDCFAVQQWLHLTPQQAMSMGCKWMNNRLKSRRVG